MPPKNKRTPSGRIDDARKPSNAEWEVEKFLSRRTGKAGVQFLVRWKGFDEKYDTWEPQENLGKAKQALAKFTKEYDHQQAASRKEAEAKHKAKVEERRKEEEARQARVRAAMQKVHKEHKKQRSNASPWWRFWVRESQDKTDPKYHNAICIIPTGLQDEDGKDIVDGHVVDISRSTNALEDYVRSKYKVQWLIVDKEIRPGKYEDTLPLQNNMVVVACFNATLTSPLVVGKDLQKNGGRSHRRVQC